VLGAEVANQSQRLSGVGDVIGDQDTRAAEIDGARHRRQHHRHWQPLVRARVELDVGQVHVLDIKRVGECTGDESPPRAIARMTSGR
jgi:hypothetical protein